MKLSGFDCPSHGWGTEISHGYNYPNDIKFVRTVLTVLALLYSLRMDEPVFKLLTPITATLTTFLVFVSVEQRQTQSL
jgi:hypothetical protein